MVHVSRGMNRQPADLEALQGGIVIDESDCLHFDIGGKCRRQLLAGLAGPVDQHPLAHLLLLVDLHQHGLQDQPRPDGHDQENHRQHRKDAKGQKPAGQLVDQHGCRTQRHPDRGRIQQAGQLIGVQLHPVEAKVDGHDAGQTHRRDHMRRKTARAIGLRQPARHKKDRQQETKRRSRCIQAKQNEPLLLPGQRYAEFQDFLTHLPIQSKRGSTKVRPSCAATGPDMPVHKADLPDPELIKTTGLPNPKNDWPAVFVRPSHHIYPTYSILM